MTKKIFRSILWAAAGVLSASLLIIFGCLYSYFETLQKEHLKDELDLAAYAVELDGKSYLEQLDAADYRVTWVAADGSVLFDTSAPAEDLENHGDREEIKEAFATGIGESSRYSATLTEKTQYQARRLADGTVLRMSVRHATILALLLGLSQPIFLVIALAIVLSVLLARAMAKSIVGPLNHLDLDHPMDNDAYEELSPLLTRIHRQHRQIDEQLHELKRQTDEFAQITDNMREGLVLLDNACNILSINPAAAKIFDTDTTCLGKPFLRMERNQEVIHAVLDAQSAGHSEIRTEKEGRQYQFDISRIESEGHTLGTVLLVFDITEQFMAERCRREFTANVSHELKTPLQSIIGSAELMENGLVRPDDVSLFIGRIRTEASRLVTLIEDIIRLSQLDEGISLPRETINLRTLAEDVTAELKDTADARNVTLTVSGADVSLTGIRRLLYEILYNLCDNAIKYNNPGGSVTIAVARGEDEATVCVSDTGIGIPPEYQSRVFERFFRVDKSHSKATGGTGLGLSIVKHAALYHNARIDLQSTPGEGTAVTVAFPMN